MTELTPDFWLAYGHRLRVTRAALGITEHAAAEAHGVTLATYRKWEAGCKQRSVLPALRFMKMYDVSADWLLGGEATEVRHHLQRGKVAILSRPAAVIKARAG